MSNEILIRAAKCRFGPLLAWYYNGEWNDVEDPENRKGVMASLDQKHNADYKVAYVSDPLLIVHSQLGITHDKLQKKLEELGLWMDEFQPVELPRKDLDGNPDYAPAFKSLPRSKNQIDRMKHRIKQTSNEDAYFFESENDIKVYL